MGRQRKRQRITTVVTDEVEPATAEAAASDAPSTDRSSSSTSSTASLSDPPEETFVVAVVASEDDDKLSGGSHDDEDDSVDIEMKTGVSGAEEELVSGLSTGARRSRQRSNRPPTDAGAPRPMPEILFACSQMSRVLSASSWDALELGMQIIRYAYGQRHRGLRFRSDGHPKLRASYDASDCKIGSVSAVQP